MSKKNVIALAIALLLGGAASANAAGIGLNVGPVGASVNVGIAPTLAAPSTFTLPTEYAPLGTDGYIAPAIMTQSAVIGTTVTTPSTTVLPAGTTLVTSNCNTGIILPGMVGMPQGLQGCNVSVLANTLPSVASLIGNNPPFVASLPVGGMAPVGEKTFARVVKRHIIKRVKKHHAHKRVVRACHHAQRILK